MSLMFFIQETGDPGRFSLQACLVEILVKHGFSIVVQLISVCDIQTWYSDSDMYSPPLFVGLLERILIQTHTQIMKIPLIILESHALVIKTSFDGGN